MHDMFTQKFSAGIFNLRQCFNVEVQNDKTNVIIRHVQLQKKIMFSFERVWNNSIFPGRFSKAEYKFLLLLFVTAWCTQMALQLGQSDVEYYKYYMQMQVFCEVTPYRLRTITMTVWLWRRWHYGTLKRRPLFFNTDDDEHIGRNM